MYSGNSKKVRVATVEYTSEGSQDRWLIKVQIMQNLVSHTEDLLFQSRQQAKKPLEALCLRNTLQATYAILPFLVATFKKQKETGKINFNYI